MSGANASAQVSGIEAVYSAMLARVGEMADGLNRKAERVEALRREVDALS